ncbi:DUF7551 domain-containing protein [Halobaculum gomorrense]|uniref:Uncharacterized protein n=1 Tax=Halobaculum gomorrense TaxID=43928 RepID=A0A1M5PAB3_9EURY|nr:hypothetical protein [Halobaculum gomorrense]SHG98389.1 hypothetical protein SAMN05443636_1508 [Halobaculum gomorrense]
MIGTTLVDLRRHIESLADPSGAYRVCCGRTGERPVPVDGLAFESRETARAAIRCAAQYRAALRRYDPQVPVCDLIAVDCPGVSTPTRRALAVESPHADPASAPDPAGGRPSAGSAIDFCHSVAGAVFEAIADSPHAVLQDAIMDEYFDAAESVKEPDELCLQLLRSIAVELAERLNGEETLRVLCSAGERMSVERAPGRGDPVESILGRLRSVGMLRSYSVSAPTVDIDESARRWHVELDGYALADDADGRLITLPVVIALFGRASVRAVAITDAVRTASGSWRLTLETNPECESLGLTSVETER